MDATFADGPMGGIRILDLTSVIMGPFAIQRQRHWNRLARDRGAPPFSTTPQFRGIAELGRDLHLTSSAVLHQRPCFPSLLTTADEVAVADERDPGVSCETSCHAP